MKRFQRMTQADVDRLTDDQVVALEKATQAQANELQRQAAEQQRAADRLRKAIRRRKERQQQNAA